MSGEAGGGTNSTCERTERRERTGSRGKATRTRAVAIAPGQPAMSVGKRMLETRHITKREDTLLYCKIRNANDPSWRVVRPVFKMCPITKSITPPPQPQQQSRHHVQHTYRSIVPTYLGCLVNDHVAEFPPPFVVRGRIRVHREDIGEQRFHGGVPHVLEHFFDAVKIYLGFHDTEVIRHLIAFTNTSKTKQKMSSSNSADAASMCSSRVTNRRL